LLRAVLIGPGIANYFRFEMKKIGFGSSYLSPGSQIPKKKIGSEDKNLQIVLDLSQEGGGNVLRTVKIVTYTFTLKAIHLNFHVAMKYLNVLNL
jgi:hypothetical protein